MLRKCKMRSILECLVPLKGRSCLLMDYCILFACLMWVSTTSAAMSIMGDECDWTGSGLTSSSPMRGITPVYLRCSTGRVTWLYPRGALRVILRHPSEQDFRACIKVHPDTEKAPAARLFLEGPRSLLPLYSYEDGGGKNIRCFNSKHGKAAIYVEATDENAFKKRISEMEYDLQLLPKGSKNYDPYEECRPCTKEELAHAFCTSDLVTRGIIRGVEVHEDMEVSQVAVKITKLIRHTTDDGETKDIQTNAIDKEDKEVTIHVAQHCGVSHGVGEFVFMASRKLGDLTLKCAPRLEDWASLVNDLLQEGKAHCVLRS